jgi:hypothetical protein
MSEQSIEFVKGIYGVFARGDVPVVYRGEVARRPRADSARIQTVVRLWHLNPSPVSRSS